MAANGADTAVDIARHCRGPCGLDPDADAAQLCDKDRPPARTGRGQPSRTALRSAGAAQYLLVSVGFTRAALPGGGTARGYKAAGPLMSSLAPTLEAYFTERLIGQRRASPNT